jgi:hypothetical protein
MTGRDVIHYFRIISANGLIFCAPNCDVNLLQRKIIVAQKKPPQGDPCDGSQTEHQLDNQA